MGPRGESASISQVEDARVISIEMVMLAALGFLTAALLTLFLSPLYRRRVARLTTDSLKRSMPLTEAEIRADKDRLRAEYAIRIHKLEMTGRGSGGSLRPADGRAQPPRRGDLQPRDRAGGATHRAGGARERPPRARADDHGPAAEGRAPAGGSPQALVPARPRDRVAQPGSEKQSRALEEATQINTQQTDEIHRLKAALNTRAARNREGLNDPRFEGEVALRTEIEVLAFEDAQSDGPDCAPGGDA